MNQLLQRLPAQELERLKPYLKPSPLLARQRLFAGDEAIGQIVFPASGVLARLVQLGGGETVEAGIVGADGVVGLPPVLGCAQTVGICVVQTAGSAYVMSADDYDEAVRRGQSPLHDVLLAYVNATIAMLAQLTACHCLHRIEQRLCRVLMQLHDRLDGDRIRTTHDALSEFLGVHRPSVTYALQSLAEAGGIALERRSIMIRSRDALAAHVCECYNAIRKRQESLFTGGQGEGAAPA